MYWGIVCRYPKPFSDIIFACLGSLVSLLSLLVERRLAYPTRSAIHNLNTAALYTSPGQTQTSKRIDARYGTIDLLLFVCVERAQQTSHPDVCMFVYKRHEVLSSIKALQSYSHHVVQFYRAKMKQKCKHQPKMDQTWWIFNTYT